MNLTAENAEFAYADAPVLTEIALSIAEGRFVAIAGPNGSGKTTLLKLLGGLITPRLGTVRLGDDVIGEWRPIDAAKRIAWVPQETTFAFGYSVLDVVLMGRSPHLDGRWFERPDDFDVARRVIDRMELGRLAGRSVLALSGGERQRVLLARALAQETPILLLDEPAAFLDLKFQASIYTMLERLTREEGKTVVAVTHDLNLASLYCDEIILLNGGRIAASGPPAEVFRRGLLEEIYATPLHVDRHPDRDRPRITPSLRGLTT